MDESSRGWFWSIATEPMGDRTRLTFTAEESSSIPLLDKLDAAIFRVGHQVRKTLATLKQRIEAPHSSPTQP